MKRGLDLVVAGALAALTAPIMLAIAIAIRLDTRGPALFWQERVGRNGSRFKVVKFRTMVADAAAQRAGLMSSSTDPSWLKLDRDPRITRVGHLLRLTSLDEMPQLWNVLRGDMSLVGPRPLIPEEDALLTDTESRRRNVSPGLTGLWQVGGRTDLSFQDMVELDLHYVDRQRFGLDLRLLAQTVPAVLLRKGAN